VQDFEKLTAALSDPSAARRAPRFNPRQRPAPGIYDAMPIDRVAVAEAALVS